MNQSGCGVYDHEFFTAAVECCACGGGFAPVPEWNIDLDYAAADQYSAELSVAYQEHQRKVADVLMRWKSARDAIDAQFWNDEFIPEAAIGEKLDEKTMRSLVTWIADGTEIKGQPLVDVFPDVKDWMLDNYNPEGRTAIEAFRMEEIPRPSLNLAEGEPVTFSFTYDEAEIMAYLEQEARMYEHIDAMRTETWEDYVADATPIWEQMGIMNQAYKREFERIDETLKLQIEQSAGDVQHWFEDSFTVTLAAKLAKKQKTPSTNYGMYAIGATTLAAMLVAGLVYKNKKSESVTNQMVGEALVY